MEEVNHMILLVSFSYSLNLFKKTSNKIKEYIHGEYNQNIFIQDLSANSGQCCSQITLKTHNTEQ